MHEYERKVLEFLSRNGMATMEELEEAIAMHKDSLMWAIESLSARKEISVKKEERYAATLSDEANGYLKGFPEEKLIHEIGQKGKIPASEIKNSIGITWAKRNGWISISNGVVTLTDAGKKQLSSGRYPQKDALKIIGESKNMAAGDVKPISAEISELSKRGLVTLKQHNLISEISITKEGKGALEKGEKAGLGQLSREVIKSRKWESFGLQQYDIKAPSEKAYISRLHPLHEITDTIRKAWVEMGFREVSGPIIESAFWNFDALFSPQDHPTREMQDTFFLSNPSTLKIKDMEALDSVKKMHVKGWRERWSEEAAGRAILRTHNTSVSARWIRNVAKTQEKEMPVKLFSTGSVFRNESVDYKHMAELHQYDGIIIGDKLTFANLIDTLKRFYAKIGLENVKIMPSYFPFTEPSLQALYYDEEHGDTIELTGGGIIRKEITKAMGLDKDKTVLAWGGGIDRLLLNKRVFGMDSLLSLYKNNIGWLRNRGEIKI